MLVFELEMISIAVMNQFCQTISGANDIHNHVANIFCAHSERKDVNAIFVVFAYMYTLKNMLLLLGQ